MAAMSIVKINALAVPADADAGDELARRFANRAGAVDGAPGFGGFELLRPTDERTTWLVVTRWRDEAAFAAWSASRENRMARAQAGTGPKPVATGAELWSFEIAGGSQPKAADEA